MEVPGYEWKHLHTDLILNFARFSLIETDNLLENLQTYFLNLMWKPASGIQFIYNFQNT